nr:hypothetical protein [Tanacetum cinerariifolium]
MKRYEDSESLLRNEKLASLMGQGCIIIVVMVNLSVLIRENMCFILFKASSNLNAKVYHGLNMKVGCSELLTSAHPLK